MQTIRIKLPNGKTLEVQRESDNTYEYAVVYAGRLRGLLEIEYDDKLRKLRKERDDYRNLIAELSGPEASNSITFETDWYALPSLPARLHQTKVERQLAIEQNQRIIREERYEVLLLTNRYELATRSAIIARRSFENVFVVSTDRGDRTF